jgi:hypothetical protein
MEEECCIALICRSKGNLSWKLNVVFCPNAVRRRVSQPFGLLVDQLTILHMLPVKIRLEIHPKPKGKGV